MTKWEIVMVVIIYLFLEGCTVDAYSLATQTSIPSIEPILTIQTGVTDPNITTNETPMSPGQSSSSQVQSDLNPLTGLMVPDKRILNRRPILIKVENLPRQHRPQWGLSFADTVYEYYTEEGTTRFAAIYFGKDSTIVGPIRSARYFDIQLVKMYKAMFVFGSAFPKLLEALNNEDFSSRLLVEQPDSCPALCRYDPNGFNLLVANTIELEKKIEQYGMDNNPQKFKGIYFNHDIKIRGDTIQHIYLRYSGAIYNRWDYDQGTGSYYRYEETQDDINHDNEVYEPLTDRITGLQISAENVVVLYSEYVLLSKPTEVEVYDIPLSGSGIGYVNRDGMQFKVAWKRSTPDDLLSLYKDDGSPFELKPGITWYEILGKYSYMYQDGNGMRFEFVIP